MKALRSLVAALLCMTLSLPAPAQLPPPAAASPAGAKTFSQQELGQLVAPIALYPDALLAQILMASTYPLEVVAADRWVKLNPSVKHVALEDAMQQQPWDPSVKSLTFFPQVLAMMTEKLDWTQKLGDALLAQQADLIAAVQALRAKALEFGSLRDSKEIKVIVETQNGATIIRIEPADPEVVYVPTYDPSVVYGTWPYPAYPPYYWYPPGYIYSGALLAFAVGIVVGAALFGKIIWSGPVGVNVNVSRYNQFNRTSISDGTWRHNVNHRGSVPYRDRAVAQQYGHPRAPDAASREAFRGYADAGREAIQRSDLSGRDLGGYDTSGLRSPTALDAGQGAQTADFANRGASSIGSARAGGNFGGGGRIGGGRR
jgi:hypothetical protein